MRDINRIPLILEKIESLWLKNPDLRLGQLIEILKHKSGESTDLFYLEDECLETGIEIFKKELL